MSAILRINPRMVYCRELTKGEGTFDICPGQFEQNMVFCGVHLDISRLSYQDTRELFHIEEDDNDDIDDNMEHEESPEYCGHYEVRIGNTVYSRGSLLFIPVSFKEADSFMPQQLFLPREKLFHMEIVSAKKRQFPGAFIQIHFLKTSIGENP